LGVEGKENNAITKVELSMAFVSGSGAIIIIGGKGNKIKNKTLQN